MRNLCGLIPLANRFTIYILAAVAEYEARSISERTKAAFAAAKARGRKFGNPNPATHRSEPWRERPKSEPCEKERRRARSTMCRSFANCVISGETLHGIALQLTAMEIETPGKRNVWRDRTVAKMLKRRKSGLERTCCWTVFNSYAEQEW